MVIINTVEVENNFENSGLKGETEKNYSSFKWTNEIWLKGNNDGYE